MNIANSYAIDIPVSNILVIQTGDIGDVVWTTPTLDALKAAFPDAALFVLTKKPFGDLLLSDPAIAGVYQTDDTGLGERLRLMGQIRRRRFDLLFDLRADSRGTFFSWMSRAVMKCALHYPHMPWRNRAFTHLLTEPPPGERRFGASMQSLRIVKGFGIPEVTHTPRIVVFQGARQKAMDHVSTFGLRHERSWVSINPFSRWTYKEWGMDKWLTVVRGLWERYGLPCVIVGSAAERERADTLVAESSTPLYHLAGQTTLPEMAGLLCQSRLHIGVDSAALHIAAACGTPVAAIYGPTNWRDWVLPDGITKVIESDKACVPCYRKGCEGSGRSLCLEELPVAPVWAAVETILEESSP